MADAPTDLSVYERINTRFCALEEQAMGLGRAVSTLGEAIASLADRLRKLEEAAAEADRLERLRQTSAVTEWSLEHPAPQGTREVCENPPPGVPFPGR